jgi:hypothetical protein
MLRALTQVACIRIPTLVISEEADRVDPPVLRQELLPRSPHAILHTLPAIRHLSPLEAPSDLAALIRAFAGPLLVTAPALGEPASNDLPASRHPT